MMETRTLTVNLDFIDRLTRAVRKWANRRRRRIAYANSKLLDQRADEYRKFADDCEAEAEVWRKRAVVNEY